MTPEEFQNVTNVSRETLARLEIYAALLTRWQKAINLVGRRTLADLWRRHMLDSAQLLDLAPPAEPPRVWIDIGSGAGFPGLVLAIMGAGDMHLVESDKRKAAFLREVARQTETDVAIHAERVEAVAPFPADVITARAVASLSRLVAMARPFWTASTQALFLKGRDVEMELTDVAKCWKVAVETIPSRTDPEGRIVRLQDLGGKPGASEWGTGKA